MLVGANVFQQIFRLDGKVAVVTGAGSGFGRTFARALADFGATVICAGRRVEALQETVSAIADAGGRAAALTLDVRDESSVDAFWRNVAAKHGRAEILVNNAGIALAPQRTHEASVRDWDEVIATNLRGVFMTTRLGLKQMLPGPGSIINIASIAGLRVRAQIAAYAATKAAVVQLTKALALEWAEHGIRVNAIAPGYFETDITRDLLRSPVGQAIVARIPQQRPGRLGELDGPLLLLASDASSYMTGAVIPVDGGHLVSTL
jgi:NAD(P)-dependent dehydrogenase (short-subunit alcohol dehydrogenase family)